jgi:hypothetical protein
MIGSWNACFLSFHHQSVHLAIVLSVACVVTNHLAALPVFFVIQDVMLVTPNMNGSYPFLGMFAKLRKTIIDFVMSVCLSAWNVAPTAQIFMKFDI